MKTYLVTFYNNAPDVPPIEIKAVKVEMEGPKVMFLNAAGDLVAHFININFYEKTDETEA